MTTILEINYMGNTYTFNRNMEDTIEDFYHISWLTAKQQPKNNKDFEKANSNAILWYYDVHNNTTNESHSNLYGIQFLDNPDNDFGNDNDRSITTNENIKVNTVHNNILNIYSKIDNFMFSQLYFASKLSFATLNFISSLNAFNFISFSNSILFCLFFCYEVISKFDHNIYKLILN